MKIGSNYILQDIVDEHIVVPVGDAADRVHGIIKLNDLGAFLWKRLTESDSSLEDLVCLVMREYEIDKSTARHDIAAFLHQLETLGCLVE